MQDCRCRCKQALTLDLAARLGESFPQGSRVHGQQGVLRLGLKRLAGVLLLPEGLEHLCHGCHHIVALHTSLSFRPGQAPPMHHALGMECADACNACCLPFRDGAGWPRSKAGFLAAEGMLSQASETSTSCSP